jgi:hypothetical protein
MRRIPQRLLAVALLWLCASCGPRTAVTSWRYATWYPRNGSGSELRFGVQRKECLEEAGIAGDTPTLPDSAEENRFIACMNAGNWCTVQFHCHKPDLRDERGPTSPAARVPDPLPR